MGRVAFTLGDVLVVVLEDPSPSAIGAAARALGSAPSTSRAGCDLLVRWRPGVRDRSVVERQDGGPRTLTLPLRDARRVPALRSLSLLTLLERGVVPLHAAAGTSGGRLVGLAGPSGAGKTGLLLAAIEHGLRPWAAEWILLGSSGVVSLGHAIRIRARHLSGLPVALVGVAPVRRLGMRVAGAGGRAASSAGHAVQRLRWARGFGRRITRLGNTLGRVAYADVPVALVGTGTDPALRQPENSRMPSLGALLLLRPRAGRHTAFTRVTAAEAAELLAGWLRHDLRDLAAIAMGGAGLGGAESQISVWLESYRRLLAERLAATECLVVEADPDARPSDLAAAVADRLRLGN